MSDIELVIKIPEAQYRTLNAKSQNDVVAAIDDALLIKAIENGKPLPEHSVTPKQKLCKDCKWWKDSDGIYRRGIEAESQCPINRKKVFEGNGYCYMFEPKMEGESE